MKNSEPYYHFQFERDFIESLRCIPMQVRMKLDTCGVKLKLSHWHQFTQAERQQLVIMPCLTADEAATYRELIQHLVIAKTGQAAKELAIADNPPWLDGENIPLEVQNKAAEFNLTIEPEQWQVLTPPQRFALIKLSRPSHENRNFLPALKEFKIT